MTQEDSKKVRRGQMTPEEIAKMDAESYDEPEGEVLNSPGTGNAKHRSRWTSDEENTLATRDRDS